MTHDPNVVTQTNKHGVAYRDFICGNARKPTSTFWKKTSAISQKLSKKGGNVALDYAGDVNWVWSQCIVYYRKSWSNTHYECPG